MSNLRTRHARERGATLIAGGIWLVAMMAIVAIAVEIARLTDTATEVQAAADSGALGAALAISKGQSGQAVTEGQDAAARNYANGQLVPTSGVQIDIGHYTSDPSASTHFTTTCTAGVDCNAARATVTVSNVKYLLASILNGQTSTTVQKTAVSAVECQGSAYPLPLTVCKQVLDSIGQDDTCGTTAPSFFMNPDGSQNACWTSLGSSSASSSYTQSIFPAQCGGTPVETYLQEAINLQNGVANTVWQALQCCIACQGIHDFVIPVVDCSAIGGCNTAPPVLGFATIHINNPTDVNPPGGGNTNCGNTSWGCSARVQASGATGITASQVCKSDLAGKPGGTSCTNFANTVAPVLGQLP